MPLFVDRSSTVEIREILVGGFSSDPMAAASHPTPSAHGVLWIAAAINKAAARCHKGDGQR